VAAVAVLSFLPFAIQFSRNFQPETIMVSLMIAAMWAMVRYDEAPSPKGIALVIVTTAAAGFVKPVSLFVLYGVFAALTIQRLGWGAAIRDRRAWWFASVAAAPALVWGVYGFIVAGFLVGQEDGRILPELLLQPAHWAQTIRLVLEVVTLPLLPVAVIGLLAVPAGRGRTFAIGALVGYLTFMLIFTYHTATHNYYHLQLVPLMALAVASCADLAIRHRSLRPVAAAVSVLAVAVGGVVGVSRMAPTSQELAIIPVAEQVGRVVDHSTHTVSVVERPWPPRQAWYYGYFAGRTWFLETELSLARATGAAVDAEVLLNRALRARDRYLVIIDRGQVDDVPGLWHLLESRYRVVEEAPAFVVFDLARKRASNVLQWPVRGSARTPDSIRHEVDSRQESRSTSTWLLKRDALHGRLRV
jgi:4-amino-4-deoxy-L-arabinose transferase-like glycosyltransferase